MGIGPVETLVLLLGMGVWLLALADCLRFESHHGNTKVIWLLLIIFVPVIGALLYLLIRRPQRMVTADR